MILKHEGTKVTKKERKEERFSVNSVPSVVDKQGEQV